MTCRRCGQPLYTHYIGRGAPRDWPEAEFGDGIRWHNVHCPPRCLIGHHEGYTV